MRREVVGRVEPLAIVGFGDRGDRSVVFVACDAAAGVLAGHLTPLKVERVAVAVVRGTAEHRHASVIVDPAALHAHWHVAPDQVFALAAPRRTFGPLAAGPETVNRGVVDPQRVECGIDRDDVWIRVADGAGGRIVVTMDIERRRSGLRALRDCRSWRKRCSADDRTEPAEKDAS